MLVSRKRMMMVQPPQFMFRRLLVALPTGLSSFQVRDQGFELRVHCGGA